MMDENDKNSTDPVRTDSNDKISVDKFIINMDSKLLNNPIEDFFDEMDLKISRELSLCFNNLVFFPNNFFQQLSNLEKLDLSHNNLEELPSSINLLTKLEYLKMDYNKFQSIPIVLAEIRSLKFLSISHNKIEKHSENLGALLNLEILNLNSNNLSQLPHSFMELNRLKELNLAENKFTIIPECIINGMRNLESLNLSFNKRIKLNVPPCSKKLTKFYAMSNGVCCKFPRWLLTSTFSTLEEVNFNETEFLKFTFPEEKALLNMRNLSITQSTLSDNIVEKLTKNMIKLENMNIGNNKSYETGNIFCKLPIQQLKNPQFIKQIYMQRTGLPLISRTVKNLQNITIMNLSENNIAWIPDEFCFLQKLEVLIINNNTISALPKNFGNLIELRELLLSCNQLSDLPVSMNNLKKLRILDLYDNNLLEIPWEIVNLENIQGLDIEYNFVSTNNLIIRETSYESLRQTIQEKSTSFSERMVGIKVYEDEKDNFTSESSTSSDSEFYHEYKENPTNEISFYNEEEKWDLSEDSTQEYEPDFVSRKKYQTLTSTFPSKSRVHFFCPDDLHAKPIKEQIRQMENDIRELIITHEDGQFDDA